MTMRNRRGIALVAALTLTVLLGLLVVGGVAASTMAQRASQLTRSDANAEVAVDYAINTVLAEPERFPLETMLIGERRVYAVVLDGGAGSDVPVAATALPGGAYWLVADAATTGLAQAHRRLNVVASHPWIGPTPAAALTVRGDVRLGAHTVFPLVDSSVETCAPAATADIVQSPGASLIGAVARVSQLAAARDSVTFFLRPAQLAALRGAPTVVRVVGDTTIAGGTFDGILIVNGNITVTGPLVISGLVIAGGRIVANAFSMTLTGAMLAFGGGAGGSPALDLDFATIRYSPCTVEKFLHFASPLRPAGHRAWVELF